MVDIFDNLFTPVAQVALIMGLAEVIKKLGCSTKLIPIIDVCLGLISGIGVYFFGLGHPIIESIVIGIALGLSACGMFSGAKNLFESATAAQKDISEDIIVEEEKNNDD